MGDGRGAPEDADGARGRTRRRKLASEKDVETLAQAVANLRDLEDLEGVKELELAVRAQRERLEAIRKG